MDSTRARRGVSLLELLVALLLLEITGVASLAAILTSQRIRRTSTAAAQVDAGRWTSYRQAELAATCANGGDARAEEFILPESGNRPAMTTTLGCGQ